MRVLSTFFTLLIFLLLAATGIFFISREILLWWGVRSFTYSLRELQTASKSQKYQTQCVSGSDMDSQISETHIRFISNSEYVVEAVCDQNTEKPILITKSNLPPYISKVPGTSGIIWGTERSTVKLQVFKSLLDQLTDLFKMDVTFLEKSRVIGVEEDSPLVLSGSEEDLGVGPVTSCEGYGFQCCAAETHVGVGERITGLTDCRDSCYRSCTNRPVVFSFTTSPPYDIRTRQVTVTPNNPVEFSYVAGDESAKSVSASIDFGDGSSPTRVDGLIGKTSHVYACNTGSCTYVVKLKLVDNWQVESYDTALSSVQVIVQGQ